MQNSEISSQSFDIQNPDHLNPELYELIPGTVLDHVLAALHASESLDPILNLSILFHDIGKPASHKEEDGKHSYHGHEYLGLSVVDKIAKRLRIPNDVRNIIKFCTEHHMKGHNLKTLSIVKLLELYHSPSWEYLVGVMHADDASRGEPLYNSQEFKEKIEYVENACIQYGQKKEFEDRMSKIINGTIIIALIPGIAGKEIGRIKNAVRDWVVDNSWNVTGESVKKKVIELYESNRSI